MGLYQTVLLMVLVFLDKTGNLNAMDNKPPVISKLFEMAVLL